MLQTKVVKKIKTRALSNFFFENLAVCEIKWKKMEDPSQPQMTIRRMPITCWILKATNTHSGYVTLTDFPLQQRQHERASVLSLNVHCLNFRFFIPCIFYTCYNKNYQQMRLFVLCLYFLFLVFCLHVSDFHEPIIRGI